MSEIRERLAEVMASNNSGRLFVVIDDAQRLGAHEQAFEKRLGPDLTSQSANLWEWGAKVPGAGVVMVMAEDPERTKKLTEPTCALNLHLVKNREGKRATLALDFVSAFLPSPQLPGCRFGNAPTRPTTISEESYTA